MLVLPLFLLLAQIWFQKEGYIISLITTVTNPHHFSKSSVQLLDNVAKTVIYSHRPGFERTLEYQNTTDIVI